MREQIEALYRSDSRRVLATLIRLLGDFELAEEALHEAFAAAVAEWPERGVPANPRAWLVSAGRYRAIDALRRRSRFDAAAAELASASEAHFENFLDVDAVDDDQLRLIFTCCHPALPPDAQLALTLREVCGLTTEEIARAFLARAPTVAQRIVRAKSKIREAGIPYEVPATGELPERLEVVLRVVYLLFNEGYAASDGDALTRRELSSEAIRLGRLIVALLPQPEAVGLLALMLLHEARRPARSTPDGDPILLDDQDRTLWDHSLIAEGQRLVERALAARPVGAYALQAAIAALHCDAQTAAHTDWRQIVALYDLLTAIDPSPVIGLNRAVALAMRDGPAAGLPLIDAILQSGELGDYALAHSARAELLRRLGRAVDARSAYARALELTRLAPERRFLERQLQALGSRAEAAPEVQSQP